MSSPEPQNFNDRAVNSAGFVVGSSLFGPVGFALGLIAGCMLIESRVEGRFHREAVRAGVGRYTADEQGRPVFEFITQESK